MNTQGNTQNPNTNNDRKANIIGLIVLIIFTVMLLTLKSKAAENPEQETNRKINDKILYEAHKYAETKAKTLDMTQYQHMDQDRALCDSLVAALCIKNIINNKDNNFVYYTQKPIVIGGIQLGTTPELQIKPDTIRQNKELQHAITDYEKAVSRLIDNRNATKSK